MAVCVPWVFHTVSWVGLQRLIVMFPNHAHFLVAKMKVCFGIQFKLHIYIYNIVYDGTLVIERYFLHNTFLKVKHTVRS